MLTLTPTGLADPIPTPAGMQCDIVVLASGVFVGTALVLPDDCSLTHFSAVLLASQCYDACDWPLTRQEISRTILVPSRADYAEAGQ